MVLNLPLTATTFCLFSFGAGINTTADMPRPPALDTAARGYCLCEETAVLVKTSFSADLWSPVLRFSGLVFEQIDE